MLSYLIAKKARDRAAGSVENIQTTDREPKTDIHSSNRERTLKNSDVVFPYDSSVSNFTAQMSHDTGAASLQSHVKQH